MTKTKLEVLDEVESKKNASKSSDAFADLGLKVSCGSQIDNKGNYEFQTQSLDKYFQHFQATSQMPYSQVLFNIEGMSV